MIVSVTVSENQSNQLSQKVDYQQKIIKKLSSITGEIPLLVLLNDTRLSEDSLFEQQFNQSTQENVPLYSNKLDDYKLFIEGSDVAVIVSDDYAQIPYDKLFHQETLRPLILFDGGADAINQALSSDLKPYALCIENEMIPALLSLSKEVVNNMLPSEILTDPLFEDVPMVVIYHKKSGGYVSYNDELYTITIEQLDEVLNHDGMIYGLAKGLENTEKTIDYIVKQAIIGGIIASKNQDSLFDEHFFEDKIQVTKLA